MVAALLTAVALVEQPLVGVAGPLPPPIPGDDEAEPTGNHAGSPTERIGRLANQVASADAALQSLQSAVALGREQANKAREDLRIAQDAAAAARRAAEHARAAAEAAGTRVAEAQRRLDRFAAGSFRQGSTIGSVATFLGSDSPRDLLARAELLDAVGGAQRHVVHNLRRARVQAANQDARAREALRAADAAQRAAAQAKAAADAAYRSAIAAAAAQRQRAVGLRARKADLEQQFATQRVAAGLTEQPGPPRRPGNPAGAQDRELMLAAAESPAGDPVGTVLNRALAQRGVPYAWGGGNAHGPTLGVPDGGAGDLHGDYRTVGFDCSGLMIYAFAPVLGYSLPHYSGAQYDSGRKVPLALKRPGDMLFWSSGGRIHHVALYLGDEQMIEAPYSGAAVRVTSVPYDGIMPYVTRMF